MIVEPGFRLILAGLALGLFAATGIYWWAVARNSYRAPLWGILSICLVVTCLVTAMLYGQTADSGARKPSLLSLLLRR